MVVDPFAKIRVRIEMIHVLSFANNESWSWLIAANTVCSHQHNSFILVNWNENFSYTAKLLQIRWLQIYLFYRNHLGGENILLFYYNR